MTKYAELVAKLSTHNTHAVGCAIYRKGKLISLGANSCKGHPKMTRYGAKVGHHAEFAAIQKLKNKNLLQGATIVVARIMRDGTLGMSKPCEICAPLLVSLGVKRVIYSTQDGYKEERI